MVAYAYNPNSQEAESEEFKVSFSYSNGLEVNLGYIRPPVLPRGGKRFVYKSSVY